MSQPAEANELTDAELLVLKAMLNKLAGEPHGFSGQTWHGFTEAHLGGEHIKAEDFDRLRDLCVQRAYVFAAQNPITKKARYAISQAGLLALKQL